MREVRCPDPPGRKGCRWFEGDSQDLTSAPPGAPLCLDADLTPPQVVRLLRGGRRACFPLRHPRPDLVAHRDQLIPEVEWPDLEALEEHLRADWPGWTLRLGPLRPYLDDDLAELENRIRRAAAAGCARVLVSLQEGGPATPEALAAQRDRSYRYRFYNLLRGICDQVPIAFAALELQGLPDQLRFNRYFGSARPCCRGLVRPG